MQQVCFFALATTVVAAGVGYAIALLAAEVAAQLRLRVETSFPIITVLVMVVIAPLLTSFLARPRRRDQPGAN